MKIFEILLPKGMSDKSLSQQKLSQIRDIQDRMNRYVDAIYKPGTSLAGKEFLKGRLRDEYGHLKSTLHTIAESEAIELPVQYEVYDKKTGEKVVGRGPYSNHRKARIAVDQLDNKYGAYRYGYRPITPIKEAEPTELPVQYEVYDQKTGAKVPGRGPYSSRSRARVAVDQLDNKYGAYRYGYRPVKSLKEAVHTVPITPKDFKAIKTLFEKPIPAGIAPIYIQDLIDDDELFEQFSSIESKNPGEDVRHLIADWIKRVMPDQMYNFTDECQTMAQKNGVLSPIHGYDSHMYTGTNDPLTGDAYGSF